MEIKFDPSRLNDFELAMISAEIKCCYHKIEVLNEIINNAGEAKGYTDIEKTTTPTANKSSQTSASFDNLPWKSYKTKQDADPNEAAWIFANAKGAENLLYTLKNNAGKTTIGSFEYQLQGAENQFIARKPVK
jgi:hypothetical protein